MIEKDLVRKGNREKDLLDNLLSYDEGGPVKPKPPINIDEYLELGVKVANMSAAEREALEFMLNKLGVKKK